ncbi:MAG: hypothetical protein LBF78_03245 [Treponema sp.]|jgi:hypothetical protein|nr:hypothetical protein [Treponema sp.]
MSFLFFVPQAVGAGDNELRIYHAEGADFFLTKNGIREIIAVGDYPDAPLVLGPGDMAQTGEGSFLELQLLPSGTALKILENTSLVYNGFDEAGQFSDISLVYGRLRLVTGNSGYSNGIFIRAGRSSVKIESGDMGAGYEVNPSATGKARPVLTLYAFQGNAEVFPYLPDAFSGAVEALAVKEGDAFSLDINPPFLHTDKKPIQREIAGYWDRRGFTGFPPVPLGETGLERYYIEDTPRGDYVPPLQDIFVADSEPATQTVRKGSAKKNAFLGAGFGLAFLGAATQTVAVFQFDRLDKGMGQVVFLSGAGCLGLGLGGILAGILLE